MSDTIAIIATCDTKGEEALYLKQRIESCHVNALVVDSGILGKPVFLEPEVTRDQVVEYSGKTIQELVECRLQGGRNRKNAGLPTDLCEEAL